MTARLTILAALVALLPALAPAAGQRPLTKDQSDFFESKVRPIFVTHCYQCHSAEEKKAKGGLQLDTREGWARGGEHGPAIVPADPGASLLLKAVKYEDPDLQMPPDGARLTDAQVAVLEQWVTMGAPDPRESAPGAAKLTGLTDDARAHWAFQPVKNPAVPAVKDAAWVKTPVDAFVLAKLEEKGLKPSAPATREALIRRATYDLTGLPPTPEEVRAFVSDTSPDAFEKVVERLLASPQYGERWGRYWLDTARYSDTTGGENRREDYRYPFAWTYRDYVIDSYNADKPYDEFLKEQIAADLLPGSKDDPARQAALGFITVGKRFNNPNDTIDERIDTLTKATLGLTVACARCHDHKFDPIPTADYYALHGVFASTTEPAEKPLVGAEPTGPEYDDFKAKLAALEEQNRQIYFQLVGQKSAEFRSKAAAYALVASVRPRGADAERVKLRNKVISENRLDRDIYQGGLRVARPDHPVFGPLLRFGEIPSEDFAKRAPDVLATVVRGGDRRRPINKLVAEAFASVKPESLRSVGDVAEVYGKLFASVDGQARAYLEACRAATTAEVGGFDAALVQLISVPAEILPAPLVTTERLREISPRLPVVNGQAYQRLRLAEINELQLTHPGSPPRAMAVSDAPNPRNSPIFIRGEQGNRGKIVPRQFLEVLAGKDRKPFSIGSGRLELAEAIANKDNPLTARVMVNRVWMHHFGQAFVRTPDDLGVQSEKPSHPELLDYLASRFVEDGWSVKKLHRLIMASAAYQQSSDTDAEYAQVDPENRLLWRANLRRIEFEAVRDSMLMFTGKLDRALGGKPVNLTDEPYSNRRSVYGYIDRGDLPELLDQFDFADPDMANSKRATTIVPQQALFFMNSPMAVDVARKVTSRPEFVAAKDDSARVAALYEVLLQRAPRAEEVALALEFVKSAAGVPAEVVAASVSAKLPDPDERPAKLKEAARKKREGRPEAMEKALKERRERRQAQQMAANQQRRRNGRAAIRNEGEGVDRKPLTVWEQYAQALLFGNEIVYVN